MSTEYGSVDALLAGADPGVGEALPTPADGPPLRILVLADRDWTHPQGGGTGVNVYENLTRWAQWGHHVTLVAGEYPGCLLVEQVTPNLVVHRMGGRGSVFPRAAGAVLRGLGRDADVVFEVINGITFLTPLWLRKPRVALVHHPHRDLFIGEFGRRRGRFLSAVLEELPLRLLYRRVPFLTISATARHELVTIDGVPADHITIAHCGVGVAPEVRVGRSPGPTLLYVGRLKAYKRIELLLDMLTELPGVTLDVAGHGDHGETLDDEIARRGLGSRVRVHGFVDEQTKTELYQRAWIHVTVSASEGWSLTVMEAALCSTPSAAMAVGGLRDSIVDGETGILADDLPELRRRLSELLADTALREAMGAAARRRSQTFTWERTAATTLGVIQRRLAAVGVRRMLPGRAPMSASAAQPATGGEPELGRALALVEKVEGWLTDDQAGRLWEAARRVRAPGRIVEIGSFRGRSTTVLATAAPAGVEVVAIDPHGGGDRGPQEIAPDSDRGQQDYVAFHVNLERAGVQERVRHVRTPSEDALAAVDGAIAMLYVDGAHRYAPALSDITQWGARVSPGGSMLIHDAFNAVGVTLVQLRLLALSRSWSYRGRTGSLAEYRRERLDGAAVARNALAQLAGMPYFLRNGVIKALLLAGLRPVTRLLGHRGGNWPY